MRLILNIAIVVAIGFIALFIYISYFDDMMLMVFGEETTYTLFVNNVPVIVTVADTPETLTRGLSGVQKLDQNEGKFFVFESAAKHGIWMKNMLIPLDIIWIDENLSVVHVEEVVEPSTFPTVFAPSTDARFVLEVNAHFVESLRLAVGDHIFVPPEILPADIRNSLQE